MSHTCPDCLLPDSYRDITFDKKGRCNYCNYYDEVEEELKDFTKHEQTLKDRIAFHKGKGRNYDALVGLSGGKDSSYVLYYLTRVLKLRVLAFTGDNNFLTEYAYNNIKLVCDKLGVDHILYRPKWEMAREFYRRATLKVGYPCFGCSFPTTWRMVTLAAEMDIPMIVMGRSRSQQFQYLMPDSWNVPVDMVWQNIAPYNEAEHKAMMKKVYEKGMLPILDSLFDDAPELKPRYLEEWFPFPGEGKLQGQRLPELLNLFLYIPYDEKICMDTLEKEIGWKRPGKDGILTHADCSIHDAADYLYFKRYGIDRLQNELAVLIREGEVTKEEALNRLPKDFPEPTEEMHLLLDKLLGIDRKDLPFLDK